MADSDLRNLAIIGVAAAAIWFTFLRPTEEPEPALPSPEYIPPSPPKSIPDQWSIGEIKRYTITITNRTDKVWPSSGPNRVRLGVHFIPFAKDNDTPGQDWVSDQRFELPRDLAPGESVALTVSVQAPYTAGDYMLRHRLLQEGMQWFDHIEKTRVSVADMPYVTITT